MKHGKYDKAFQSFLRLRAHPIIAARDYYYSHVIYEEELALSPNSTYFSRMRDCFTIPRIRRANYGASTVMLAQQMCGSEFGEERRLRFGMCQWKKRGLIGSQHYLVLQLDNLHRCQLHAHRGAVRFARVRRGAGRIYHSDVIHD